MAWRQVDLRVQVYGDQTVEYALHRPSDANKSSFSFLYWCFVSASAASAGAWHAWQWRSALHVSAMAALLALLVYRFNATAIVEGATALMMDCCDGAESLLVVPSLGVKLIKKRRNGSKLVKFIDQCDICAVIVNEAITFNDVVYYIAFMIQGQDTMVLAYETFRPRVAVLQQIFHGVKAILFPSDDGSSTAHAKMRFPSSVIAVSAS